MSPSPIEETLRGMMDEQQRRELEAFETAEQGRLARLFSIARDPRPLPTRKTTPPRQKRSGGRRGDLIVAGFGIALGFGCAAFPWYIFLNQDKFGVQAMQFAGGGNIQDGPIYLGDQGERVGAPMSSHDIPPMELDLFATGTARHPHDEDGDSVAVALDQQPFPGDTPQFSLVFATTGRAMISDETGLWVVQAGSLLPDNSRVARIEQRGAKWVLVTSADRTLEAAPQ